MCLLGCALCVAAAALLFRFISAWEQHEALRLMLHMFD